ncbi:unnamed protein product [Haemonchus placei]|uniref:APH domain-containing protein n=1 Tax=Haemonchus placei TaxID=6290 RepID=A0A0N4WZ73_HAEPC|nr:unnamed protein product [Haemonchus placei]
MPPRVFVHGEPYASNIFLINDSHKIAAVIDWTGLFSYVKQNNYDWQMKTIICTVISPLGKFVVSEWKQ